MATVEATVTPIRTTRVVVDGETQERMRTLLEQTRGVIMRPVRKVGGWFSRAFSWVRTSAPVQWVRGIARRGWAVVRSLADRLGRAGVVALAVDTATNKRGQAAIAATGRAVVNAAAWTFDLVVGTAARILRVVPGPTRWLGNQLIKGQSKLGVYVAAGLNWSGWSRFTSWLNPEKTWVRNVGAFCRGVVLGRIIRSFIARRWLRLVVGMPLIWLTAPQHEKDDMRRWWNEQVTMRGERRRDAALWTNPNGVPAAAGKATQEAVVDLAKAKELAEKSYTKLVDNTITFFAKDSKFSTEGACAKALYTLVHPQFKELLRSQQAAKAAREFAGIMVHQFQQGESPYDQLGDRNTAIGWNPELVAVVREQAEAAVATFNTPAPVR